MYNKQQEISQVIAAVALGSIVLSLQILLIRALLQLFQGNEITIGLSLSVWLLGTSLGSLLFSRLFKGRWLSETVPLLLLPVAIVEIILIRYLPLLFNFIPGVPLDFGSTGAIFLITILPVSFLCGAFFPYMVEVFSGHVPSDRTERIKTVYIWESIGAMLAALLMSFILFPLLSSFQIVGFFLFLFYAVLSWIIKKARGNCFLLTLMVFYFIIAAVLLVAGNTLQQKINEIVFDPYTVEDDTDTPYGNIKILELEGQAVVTNQGTIAYTLPDPYSDESHILLPLLLHPEPRIILVIGGNLSGYLSYLEKFRTVREVYYLEKDPYLMNFQKELIRNRIDSLNFQIRFMMKDARQLLKSAEDSFDIISLNKPEPYTLSDNRFYTREFYQLVRSCLDQKGVLTFSIRSSENYLNPALAAYTNLMVNTLREMFPEIFIIPGDDQIFLVSPSLDIAKRVNNYHYLLKSSKIDPQFFSAAYLAYRISRERLQSFQQQRLKRIHSEQNHDFNLRGYLYHYRLWGPVSDPRFVELFTVLQQNRWLLSLLILILFILIHSITIRHKHKFLLWELMLVGGYSIALQIVFLLEYQILFGTVYSAMTIIFGLFMLGLAVGAAGLKLMINKFPGIQLARYGIAGFIILSLILFVPASLLPAYGFTDFLLVIVKWGLVPFLIFMNGFLTGGYFSLMTSQYYRLSPSSTAGITYGYDLAGSVVAAFVVSIILIPLFEIRGVLFLLLSFMAVQLIWRGK